MYDGIARLVECTLILISISSGHSEGRRNNVIVNSVFEYVTKMTWKRHHVCHISLWLPGNKQIVGKHLQKQITTTTVPYPTENEPSIQKISNRYAEYRKTLQLSLSFSCAANTRPEVQKGRVNGTLRTSTAWPSRTRHSSLGPTTTSKAPPTSWVGNCNITRSFLALAPITLITTPSASVTTRVLPVHVKIWTPLSVPVGGVCGWLHIVRQGEVRGQD